MLNSIAVQYLEGGQHLDGLAPKEVQERLRATSARVTLSRILIGWNVPEPLVEVCRSEAERMGAPLYYWHPLLCGDGRFVPRPEWRTIGRSGSPVAGFRDMPEFTFVCPNRPEVREAVLDHLADTIGRGGYQGVFLDRIRFPAPSAAPPELLACFCDDCSRAARESGLDLDALRRRCMTPAQWLDALFHDGIDELVDAFIRFRSLSVARLVDAAAVLVRGAGLEVGLDCFSPSLTRMVGQDLAQLDSSSDWIKIMTYGHAFGPAGLPFELTALADWLISEGMEEPVALGRLAQASGLPLPTSLGALREAGLEAAALSLETRRAQERGVRHLLVGMELVEMEGVTSLNADQIARDWRAFSAAGPDGVVLCWDLWRIPMKYLDLIQALRQAETG
jgi:hypothetical protein